MDEGLGEMSRNLLGGRAWPAVTPHPLPQRAETDMTECAPGQELDGASDVVER